MSHLALVLPGGPFFLSAVLRIPAVALGQLQADVRDIGLPGYPPSGRLDENRDYYRQIGAQIQDVVDGGDWETVIFVAKSIGTVALAAVGAELRLPVKVNALWLTPLFVHDEVRDGASATRWRSLVVSGSADGYYEAEGTAAVVTALEASELVIDGGDHNLEIAGDVIATVNALERLAQETLAFLTLERPPVLT